MKKSIKMIFIIILMIPIILQASTFTYDDAQEVAEEYRNSFSDSNIYFMDKGGFISKEEYEISVKNTTSSYLFNGYEYWTSTASTGNNYYVLGEDIFERSTNDTAYVKVKENVKADIKVTGTGTTNDPWEFIPRYNVKVKTNNSLYGLLNNKELIEEIVDKGKSLTITLNPEIGYEYKTDNCGDTTYSNNKLKINYVYNDIDCKVTFDKATYKVTIVSNGATSQANPNILYLKYEDEWYTNTNNTEILENNKLKSTPTRVGYTFNGCYTEKNGNGTQIIDSNGVIDSATEASQHIDSNSDIYTNWKANTYTITLNGNGATIVGTTSVTATYDSVVTISNPTRAGYSFAGWTVTSGLNTSTAKYGTSSSSVTSSLSSSSTKITAQYFKNLTAENNGSVTLTANWTQCSAGYYNDGSKTTCTKCPAGYTSEAGTTAQSSCYINVSEGKYIASAGSATQTSCGKGTYKGSHTVKYGSTSSCDNCPSGYRDGSGTTAQSNCVRSVSAGYYVATAKATSNTTCGTGTYKASHTVKYGSTSSCDNCPSGYGSTDSTASTLATQCYLKTTAGKYIATAKSSTQTNCSAGTYSASEKVYYGNTNTCTKCSTGYYSAAGATSCTANTYTIKYVLGGGTKGTYAPTSATYDNVVRISNPTKPGYTFVGWTITSGLNTSTAKYGTSSSSVTSSLSSSSTKVKAEYYKNLTTTNNGSVTLTANYQANTYTINYYVGNGTSTKGTTKIGYSTCTYNSTCTLTSFSNLGGIFPYSSADNTQNGKTNYGWFFYGWSTSQTGTSRSYANSATFTYTTVGNINLYAVGAKWFSFYSGVNPTTYISSQYQYWNPYSTSTDYMTSITIPNQTNINTWEFIGYRGGSSSASSTVTYNASQVGSTVKPAYNTWGYSRSVYKRTLTLNYNANGGSGSVSSQTATQYYNSGYGSNGSNVQANVSAPTFILRTNSFSKTGYYFSKWASGSTSGTQYAAQASYSAFAPSVTNTTLTRTMYAIWNPYYVTINFKHIDGTLTTPTSYNGSTFNWTTKSNYLYVNNYLTAYYLKYNESLTSDGLLNYNNENYLKITRSGYTGKSGAEWKCLSGNCNKSTYSQTTAYSASDFCDNSTSNCTVTLGVNWTANTNTPYKVQHWQQKVNSTEYALKDTETFTGTTGASITPAVKTTYTGFKSPSTQTTTILADGSRVVNYYYTRNSYTVTLTKGTGISSVTGAGTYQYGATVTLGATASVGYTWSKWTGYKTTTTTAYSFTMPAQDVSFTANATANKYSINYALNGGTTGTYAPNSAIYDSVVRISKPSKTVTITGYENGTGATIGSPTSSAQTFLGWSVTSGLNTSTAKYGTSNSSVTSSISSSTTKITDQYFKNLTATNNGSVTLTANWNIKSKMSLPTISKSGYSCKWNTKADGSGSTFASGGVYIINSNTPASISLYGICEPYKLSFNCRRSNAENCPDAVYANSNGKVTIPSTIPSYLNYTFVGWQTKSDGTGVYYSPGDSMTLTGDTTLYMSAVNVYIENLYCPNVTYRVATSWNVSWDSYWQYLTLDEDNVTWENWIRSKNNTCALKRSSSLSCTTYWYTFSSGSFIIDATCSKTCTKNAEIAVCATVNDVEVCGYEECEFYTYE